MSGMRSGLGAGSMFHAEWVDGAAVHKEAVALANKEVSDNRDEMLGPVIDEDLAVEKVGEAVVVPESYGKAVGSVADLEEGGIPRAAAAVQEEGNT